jgi:DNA-binding beta-propeller fold protein YncE
MDRNSGRLVGWASAVALLLAVGSLLEAQDKAPLELTRTIPLEGSQGKIDHLAADASTGRVFVAASGSNAVLVVDLNQGKVVHRIDGQAEPQGVVFIAEQKRVAVANGKDGSCRLYDADSFKEIKSFDFKEDGDNVRIDPRAKRLYVAHEAGGLGVIDLEKLEKIQDLKLEAHPEAFQLEKEGPRIFVNVPDTKEVVVLDREKGTVLAKWPLGKLEANFAMALDEANHRLLIACRRPSKLAVLDTDSGKIVAELSCSKDTDDLHLDAAARRIYVTSGEGFIDTFEQKDADHYRRVYCQSSAPGARTSAFIPEQKLLVLAVPQRDAQKAELRVYKPR